MKILIIEDDKVINKFLTASLKANNYEVISADCGLLGISLFLTNNPQLILLDMGLPDIDGLEVVKQIRAKSAVAIIIVSVRNKEKEKVEALDAGADDFVTKPFNINELLARVRVALRKFTPPEQNNEFVLKDLFVDKDKRKVYVNSVEVHLTPIEYKMLILLIDNQGKVLTHSYIQAQVWGYAVSDDYQSLRVFMASIRRKLRDNSTLPKYITTEVGVGYRLLEE
ncbi:MAG: response regulator transcription factor [Clostridia bacterium]